MDLPFYLESEDFVYGKRELHQTMEVLLREERGTLLQDFELGSQITPHITDKRLLHAAVLSALEPIRDLNVEDIFITNPGEITIVYKYEDLLSSFYLFDE